ncbi:hypothetical protein PENTCL1PPCAC_4922, partial [Pristionchus entomophagus]
VRFTWGNGTTITEILPKGPPGPNGIATFLSPIIGPGETATISVYNLFAHFTPENATTTRYSVGTNYTASGSFLPSVYLTSLLPVSRSVSVFWCNYPVCGQCVKEGQEPVDPKVVKWSRVKYEYPDWRAYYLNFN